MAAICRFKPGEIIIKEDDIGEAVYIVERGRVDVTKQKEGEKIYLGYMTSGDIFGEMSIIDDKPRSATVTAIEETIVNVIHRDEFFDILQSNQDAAVKILKALFNRLRETNIQLLQLQAEKGGLRETPEFDVIKEDTSIEIQVSLEGLTPVAAKTLPANYYTIKKFPFRIGRVHSDPLAHNDLSIPDAIPYQISRHHVMIIRENYRVGVVDTGSTLGVEVNGTRFGGSKRNPGPVFFDNDAGTLVLGNSDSLFRYKVAIERGRG